MADSNSTKNLSKVKKIILVASGKGGVGKSTTTVNLALALRTLDKQVGIMDADIYGPSQSRMLGVDRQNKPTVLENNEIMPVHRYGLKSMSAAYLSEAKAPMIWRGPMAVKALKQLLTQTRWGELDYLLIDMPPGTGDIHISIAQQFNVSSAIVVTTPQGISEIDARKAIEMFLKVDIPVLGIVENMSTYTCPSCNHTDHIFGKGAAGKLESEYHLPALGALPLKQQIQEDVDAGVPSIVQYPDGEITNAYLGLAAKVISRSNQLAGQTREPVRISVV